MIPIVFGTKGVIFKEVRELRGFAVFLVASRYGDRDMLWHLVSHNDSSSILYPIVHRLTLIFNIFQKEK